MTAINPQHPMSQFAQENAVKLLACIIWKMRHHLTNLAIEITAQDMEQLAAVFMNGGQRGLVACTGKGDRIVLQLIDQQTGKMLLTPQNDENSPHARMMARCMEARKRAPIVADKLVQFRNADDEELRREAANILKLLTWEPE